MKIITYKNLKDKKLKKILSRADNKYLTIKPLVCSIIENVKKNGDKALIQLTKKFDGVDLKSLKVSKQEIKQAYSQVSKEFLEALRLSIKNQTKFQKSLLVKKSKIIKIKEGVKVWREWRPIEKIGLYVPGGLAKYPSSLVMVGVPAKIAGCKQLVVCSPPNKNGSVPASTLVAANEVGVKTIFKVGGAQAIAAMAYGTESIPKVFKVYGAGNIYVTAAKMTLFGKIAIDLPAGPSEILIIADQNANPKWIAADLISQCEHSPDSAAILITNSKTLAKQVKSEVFQQAGNLSSKKTITQSLNSYGAIIIVDNWKQAIDISNNFAPEHLEINTKNYMKLKDKVINAGSVFLGKYSSEPAGDYVSGSNHILPTNGYAKMFSGLSIDDFGKQIEFQVISKQGLESLKPAINAFAKEEGLPAHANAVNIRFKGKEQDEY